MSLTNFDPRRYFNNRQFVFLATRSDSLVPSCISKELGKLLLSTRRAEIEIRREDE